MSDKNYSILDRYGEYCGNVSLQRPESKKPEIGIDLMARRRNKGYRCKSNKEACKTGLLRKRL